MHPKTLQQAAAAEAQLVLFQHSVGATVPVLWHGVHCERTQTEAQVHCIKHAAIGHTHCLCFGVLYALRQCHHQ